MLRIGQWQPDVVVWDTALEGPDPRKVARALSGNPDLGRVKLIVVHDEDEEFERQVRQAGVEFVVLDDEDNVMESIRRALL